VNIDITRQSLQNDKQLGAKMLTPVTKPGKHVRRACYLCYLCSHESILLRIPRSIRLCRVLVCH